MVPAFVPVASVRERFRFASYLPPIGAFCRLRASNSCHFHRTPVGFVPSTYHPSSTAASDPLRNDVAQVVNLPYCRFAIGPIQKTLRKQKPSLILPLNLGAKEQNVRLGQSREDFRVQKAADCSHLPGQEQKPDTTHWLSPVFASGPATCAIAAPLPFSRERDTGMAGKP